MALNFPIVKQAIQVFLICCPSRLELTVFRISPIWKYVKSRGIINLFYNEALE